MRLEEVEIREDGEIDVELDCEGLVLPLLERKGDALFVSVVVKEFRVVEDRAGDAVDVASDVEVSDPVIEEVDDIGGDCVKDTSDDGVAEDRVDTEGDGDTVEESEGRELGEIFALSVKMPELDDEAAAVDVAALDALSVEVIVPAASVIDSFSEGDPLIDGDTIGDAETSVEALGFKVAENCALTLALPDSDELNVADAAGEAVTEAVFVNEAEDEKTTVNVFDSVIVRVGASEMERDADADTEGDVEEVTLVRGDDECETDLHPVVDTELEPDGEPLINGDLEDEREMVGLDD